MLSPLVFVVVHQLLLLSHDLTHLTWLALTKERLSKEMKNFMSGKNAVFINYLSIAIEGKGALDRDFKSASIKFPLVLSQKTEDLSKR